MTQLLEDIIAVEVPEGARFATINADNKFMRTFRNKFEHSWLDDIRIPEGNWQFLFTTQDVTEEQAAKVVGSKGHEDQIFYTDYDSYNSIGYLDSYSDSINSLLRSKFLPTDKNYAILRKQKTL